MRTNSHSFAGSQGIGSGAGTGPSKPAAPDSGRPQIRWNGPRRQPVRQLLPVQQGPPARSRVPARSSILADREDARSAGSSGGVEGSRTPDLCIANASLSQLSYGPTLNKMIHGIEAGCQARRLSQDIDRNWRTPRAIQAFIFADITILCVSLYCSRWMADPDASSGFPEPLPLGYRNY